MHELSMVRDIIQTVCERKTVFEKAGRVTRIHLKLGKHAAVDPESLRFCFGLLAEGTELAGAVLEIKEQPEASVDSIEVEVG
ncbi:MAG: hydrogenase maturation nickel metallochaperone HypA [Bacillota bacterium]